MARGTLLMKGVTDSTKGAWLWHPPLPLETVPVLVWPPRPAAALKHLLGVDNPTLWRTGDHHLGVSPARTRALCTIPTRLDPSDVRSQSWTHDSDSGRLTPLLLYLQTPRHQAQV